VCVLGQSEPLDSVLTFPSGCDTLEYSWVKVIAVSMRLRILFMTLQSTNNHLEELKKKTAAAEEVLERTASLFDELQKQEWESHLMLQKFGHVITSGIACQP